MSAPPKPLSVGDLVGGTYKLERALGRGSMGTVYEAAHVWLDRRFAVKVVSSEGITAIDSIERFHREARLTSGLHHPNIVEVTDYNLTPDGIPYLVMELLQGESLLARIKREGQLELPVAMALFRQMIAGLAAAHAKNVIHRDLKPQNIFICADGSGQEVVKLLDFGLSKLLGSGSRLTQTGTVMGSIPYIAPEQLRAELVDQRADLHSLGAILFEMLSGRRPYLADTVGELIHKVINVKPPSVRQLVPEIPAAIDVAIRRAMAKAPARRWPEVTGFWHALCDAVGLEAQQTEQDGSDVSTAGALGSVRTLVDDVPRVGPAAKVMNQSGAPTRALQAPSTPRHRTDHSLGAASTVQKLTSQDLIPVPSGQGDPGSPSTRSAPRDRPGIVSSQTAMAETALSEGSTGPPQPGGMDLTGTLGPRSRWRLIVLLGLAVTVLGGVLGFVVSSGRSRRTASLASAANAAPDSSPGTRRTTATTTAPVADAAVVDTAPDVVVAATERRIAPDAAPADSAAPRQHRSKDRRQNPVKPRVKRGTLQITVFADQELLPSTIYLDGKPVGMTPLYLRDVPAGRHRVEARAAGYRTRKRRVLVKPRRSNSFVITLEKKR